MAMEGYLITLMKADIMNYIDTVLTCQIKNNKIEHNSNIYELQGIQQYSAFYGQ